MRFLKLTLSYDGTAYAGWQIQPDRPTLQGTLEGALQKITSEPIRVIGSGRTDSGVHALAQVVSFATECELAADVLCRAINANLPGDVTVHEVQEVPEGFHAIRDAVRKRYRYVIDNGPVPDAFLRHYAWHVPGRLDAEAMHRAAQSLAGEHDFSSFRAAGSECATSVRTIFDICVARQRVCLTEAITLEVEADGFLYNMVRNIVGTLIEVGRGGQPETWIAEVLAAKERKAAGMTAPPHGLFLVRVDYQ